MAEGYNFGDDTQKILFDLRQTYAIKILEPILLSIESHRERNEFAGWYEKLTRSLYTNISQKISDEEREEYHKLNKKTLEVINNLSGAYQGKDKTPINIEKIKDALQELEIWLKSKMEANGLYGKGAEYDWDEI